MAVFAQADTGQNAPARINALLLQERDPFKHDEMNFFAMEPSAQVSACADTMQDCRGGIFL